ncbi:MAG: FHA domain-containing protein [Pseudonocardiaceae bacterium]
MNDKRSNPDNDDDTTVTYLHPSPPRDTVDEVHADDLGVHLADVPRTSAVLVVKRGPNAGAKFTLDRVLSRVGRHPESEIFLDDVTVSRRHAEIVREDHRFLLRDAGSLNGTYVNRERKEEAVLANGDELQIGKFKLVFFSGRASDSASPFGE